MVVNVRFGTKMLDSTVSKIPQVVLLRTSILIHILDRLRKGEVHGWMRLLVEVVCCHVMVPLQGCLLPTWCAINHHQLGTNQAS